jgi:Zn-dependent protease
VTEATASSNPTDPSVAPPQPIHNCPQCSHWLPEGTLACPDCQTIVYSAHLRLLASMATQQEQQQKWAEARATWASMLEWIPAGSNQAEGINARIQAIDDRGKAAEESKAKWTRRLGPLAPVVFFLAKAKSLIFVLFKFKFLLSFFAFFGLYWAIFGWKFGLGFTLSIMIHELGHYVAARRRGLKVDLPVFLPGLGAYVRWYSMGVTLDTLSAIALAGPFFGLLAAAACAGIYFAGGGPIGPQEAETTNSLWAALAYTGAWINLINLVPVLGLDGAQATHALNRTQRGLILIATLVFYAILHEGVFLFIAAGMAWRTFTGFAPEKPSTPTMVRFMLLLFLLGALMFAVPETHGRQF